MKPNTFRIIDRIKEEWAEYPITKVSFHKKFAPANTDMKLIIDGVEVTFLEEDNEYGGPEKVRIYLPNFDVTRHILNEEWSR